MTQTRPGAPHLQDCQPTLTPSSRNFVTRADLQSAVSLIPTTTDKAWRQQKGPRYRLEFSGASVRVTSTDYSRSSKTDDRAQERKLRDTAQMFADSVRPRGKRTSTDLDWSQKSRARMPLRFATVDYTKMFDQGEYACLVTLTYPMEWQRLAPTPKAFKDHVNALRARFRVAWGDRQHEWAGIWKMEFQGRGAPHLHIGSTVPLGTRRAPLSQDDLTHLEECSDCYMPAHTGRFEFKQWLSRTWSQIIFKGHELSSDAPVPYSPEGWFVQIGNSQRVGTNVEVDQGGRYSDAKRVGIYFAKHGLWDKEYQNHAPELWKAAVQAGERSANFWGLWVVRPMIVSKETREALIMHIMSSKRNLGLGRYRRATLR